MNVLNTDRKYKLSDKFINNIAELYVGYIDKSLIDKFIYSLEKNFYRFPINSETESNLYRILSSRYDKVSFVVNCINHPIYSHLLVAIASCSNYLTDILIKDPEYFYYLTRTDNLQKRINEAALGKEIKNSISKLNSFEGRLNSLKSLKRKETLRIGVNDILGYTDIKTTTDQLSVLAKTISDILFTICYKFILQKYKIKKVSKNYSLIALGKLGGNELNYSSDIDLILIFYKNIKTNNKEYFELLTETLQLFIESSNKITENGYLYRVDLRLRPDGKTSPLCRTLNDTLHYYETRGEDWERQMLIKASFVSGDKKLYNKFIEYLNPFIYPKSFRKSPSEQIKKLKTEIENKLPGDKNIKLIKGGIRDIEFSVQALQLLNGGKIPDIRTGNTLEAIRKLKRNKILSKEETEILHSAYYLYRKIEHYQQLKNDRQTHDIPDNRLKLYTMSIYLGFRNANEFETFLNSTKIKVRKIYDSIVVSKTKDDYNKNVLGKINFKDDKNAYRNFDYLESGIGITKQRQFDKNTSLAFSNIKNDLIKYLKVSSNPDIVLNNFVSLIRRVKIPSIWYKELKNKKFANSILKICNYSNKLIELILDKPNLTDFILSKKVFETITLKDLPRYNIEEMILVLTFQFTTGKISHLKFSNLLSNYIKLKIIEYAKIMLEKNTGKNNFLIAGMGSFSINEMTFISDIDLIFITNFKNNKNLAEKNFQYFLKEINKQLKPFKCDCRLRPEGKSSQLVWNINGYTNYLNTRAKLWELQSLNKINFIYGNKRIFNQLIKSVESNVNHLEKMSIKHDMLMMRKKLHPISHSSRMSLFNIKTGTGGILDIDFITQFFILSGKLTYKKWRGKSILKILEYLIRTKRNKNDFKELKKNLVFLKKLSLVNQNISNSNSYVLPSKKEKQIGISEFLKYPAESVYEEDLTKVRDTNREIFKKIFS